MPTCIWCLAENAPPSIEHIIPEALGCPEGAVLTGGVVCKSCNNGLAHLDRAVIADFDLQAFFANVPRKGGRPPVIRGRGNLVATRGINGPEISINMDRRTVFAHDGSQLGGFGNSTRNVQAKFKRRRNRATINCSVAVGQDPKFVRGITKIAFSSFARCMGPEAALPDKFNAVRSFVRDGVGKRPVLMLPSDDLRYFNLLQPPFQSQDGGVGIGFRIACAEFVVDLSPSLSIIPAMVQEALKRYGPKGYALLPAA